MGLETSFTAINDLNSDWPLGTDPKSDGDNHLRGIKAALKANVYGTATEAQLKVGGAAALGVKATEARAYVPEMHVYPTASAATRYRMRNAGGVVDWEMDTSGNVLLGMKDSSAANPVTLLQSDRSAKSLGLYYNGSEKLRTSSGGVTVTGTLSAGSLSVSGSMTLGGLTLTGPLVMSGYTITSLGNPIISSDAATKNYVDTKTQLYLSDGVSERVTAEALGAKITGSVYPNADSSGGNCGGPSYRWGTVYAVNGTINTSDEREKRDITLLDPGELRAARRIARMCRSYYWKNEGIDTKRHYGVIAQEVVAVLESEDVDAYNLGLVHREGNRWGVNYGELSAFVAAGLEQEIRRLEHDWARILERLSHLEQWAEGTGGADK